MKSYISNGTICLYGPYNLIYAVCEISYRYCEDDTFEYVFTPNYSVISLLNDEYFQGIPGLNLDLQKEEYVRKNIIPVFISERVPQENREDYNELLSELNMSFMDPILYLKRTKRQYSGDGLFVLDTIEKKTIDFDNFVGKENNNAFIKVILSSLSLGNNIKIGNQFVDDNNRRLIHDVLSGIYSRSLNNMVQLQRDGIEKAKRMGKYKGRKPIEVDLLKFIDKVDLVEKKKISAREAAKELGISIDKYYRMKKSLSSQ